MKKILFLCLILGATLLFAQQGEVLDEFPEAPNLEKVGQAGYTFLKIGVDARTAGMAEAGVTIEGDAAAIFYNPAGITAVKGKSVFAGHVMWFADIQKSAVAGVYELGKFGHFGISAATMNYNTVEGTEIDINSPLGYTDTGNLDIQEYQLGLTYGKRFTDRFGVGVSAQYCRQDLLVVNSDVLAFDVGTIYNIGWKGLKVGMSIQHFARNMKYVEETFQLPLTFHIGAQVNLLDVAGVSSEIHRATLLVEANNPIDYSERIHIGSEYGYNNLILLRAGYKFNYDEEGLSLGVGVHYAKADFSYAFATFGGYLGSVNRFSLAFHL